MISQKQLGPTDYITFCENNTITSKSVTIFPNNKPWVTNGLKSSLTAKKYAFLKGDKPKVKEMEKEFRSKAILAKINYKNKLERKLQLGLAKDAWGILNKMMGREKRKQGINYGNNEDWANELNKFYSRFDVFNFQKECDDICSSLSPSELSVEEEEVISCFKRINPLKAPGPDGLKGRVLKSCADQLGHVFTYIFQLFINCHFFPVLENYKYNSCTQKTKCQDNE